MKIFYRNAFEKDIKRDKKRGLDLKKLQEVIKILANNEILPKKYKDHPLIGNYAGHRECHIQSDWLLIYKKEDDILIFERTGTHSDLFKR